MPGALGWFQKYQKSLMLVLLAPALIGMGITGAIMSVVQSPGEMTVAELFGEPVTQTEYGQVIQTYKILSGTQDEDPAFRFMAMYLAARRSGLAVSDTEVGQDIVQEAKYLIAQHKALKDVQAAKLPAGSDAAEKLFRDKMLGYLLDPDFKFVMADYQDVLKNRQGMPVKAYEAHQKRSALVQRYLQTLRELATVTPAEVREAYDEKYHLRALDLIELSADAYMPQAEAPAGEPGHVTDAQLKEYYQLHAADFDVPRQVSLGYVAAPLKAVEASLQLPGDAALEAWNRQHGIAPTTSFNALRMEIIDAWRADAARQRAAELMDAVADRVEAAEGAVDLAEVAVAVEQAHGTDVLEHGTTGLIELDALADERLLEGPAATRWFKTTGEAGDTSDVLASEDAWFLLKTEELQHKRTPEYAAITERVRDAYVNGSPQELRDYYEQYKSTRYRDEPSYELEAVVAEYAKFEGDDLLARRQRARDALSQALNAAQAWQRKDRNFSAYKFNSALPSQLPQEVQDSLAVKPLDLTTEELEAHPLVAPAAGEIDARVGKGFSEYPIQSKDDTAWFGYRVLSRRLAETRSFEEVEERVREDVRRERALRRAEAGAQDTLAALAGKRGEELEAALQELGLEARRTEFFDREATRLEGIEDAGALVAEAFSAEAEVGGPYLRAVPDFPGRRVFLMRVAAKEAAPADKWADEYTTIRKDLLSKKRMDFAEAQVNDLILRAKGIDDEHLAYVAEATDGPGGVSQVTLRQVFLPPDREIVEGWLEEQARAQLTEAQQALQQGSSFEAVVDKFSEDDATRARGGELPALTREELSSEFGINFAERVFALPVVGRDGAASAPIESSRGLHLVRKTSQQGGKITIQHLLVRTDPVSRQLPEAIRQKAEQASREKLEQALAELEAGEPFGVVAQTYGDALDPNGRGQTFDLQYVTALERAAFKQPLEWEPSGEVLANDPAWTPEPVQVELPSGPTWQLFACERDPNDRAAVWEDTGGVRNRLVYHIQTSSPQRMESVRGELSEWMREQVEEQGRPMFQRVLEKFQELAVEYSEAPTKGKAGALGRLTLRDSARPYGVEFLEKVFGAQEPRPGVRTGVFRSAKGYHLVEVVDVTAEQPEERREAVGRSLLAGTDWRT